MKRSPMRRKPSTVKKPLLGKAIPERVSGPLRPAEPRGKGLAHKKRPRPLEPGESAWKRKRYGRCAVCGAYGRLVLHHLLTEQEVRKESGAERIAAGVCWDRRNALPVGAPLPMGGACTCHSDHHAAKARIPMTLVSPDARRFAAEVLGQTRAPDYFARNYSTTEGEGT